MLGCSGLVGADNGGKSSNPYVKLSLDSLQKQQTKHQPKTLTPVYQGEEFSFDLTQDAKLLRTKIYSHSRTSKTFLGEARVDLGAILFTSGNRPEPGRQTLPLGDPSSQMAKAERKHVEKRKRASEQQPYGSIELELRFVEEGSSPAAGPPPILRPAGGGEEQGHSSGLDSSIESSMYESADDAEF